jgi:hypothetical protein
MPFIGREKHPIPGASNGLDGFSQLKQPLSRPSSPSTWASSAESGLSTNNTEQFFVKPVGMRPNTVFIGRELELAELHKMLMDKRRRAEGTSAVLLQCLPGGGKTHLAREYIYQYRDEYPGGIFFVRAKSLAELAAGFWDIARKVNLSLGESNNPQHFVSAVRKWLNRRHEWLDGIHFSYTQDLRNFIPDSKDTSLLYTSTERAVVDHHYFMNPQIIRTPLLSAREAQILLQS